MGLDDFASGDSSDDDDEQSSSTSSSSTQSKTSNGGATGQITDPIEEKDMSFYGTGNADPGTRPMERKGAMSQHSVADLARTVEGELNIAEDHVKYHLPIFTIFSRDNEYSEGERYQLKHDKESPRGSWNGKVVACIGVVQTELGSMNKEVAMFEAGSPSKKRVMSTLNSNLGDDLTADTDIYINFFADAFFLRDLAQANEQFREGELIGLDDIGSKVVRPKQLRVALDQRGDED